jgi:hypothetical protein
MFNTYSITWSRQMKTNLPPSFTEIPPTGSVTADLPVSTVNRCDITCAEQFLTQLEPWLQNDRDVVCHNVYHRMCPLQHIIPAKMLLRKQLYVITHYYHFYRTIFRYLPQFTTL